MSKGIELKRCQSCGWQSCDCDANKPDPAKVNPMSAKMTNLTPIEELHQRCLKEICCQKISLDDTKIVCQTLFLRATIKISLSGGGITLYSLLLKRLDPGHQRDLGTMLPDALDENRVIEVLKGIFGAKEQFCEWTQIYGTRIYAIGCKPNGCAPLPMHIDNGCAYCKKSIKEIPFKGVGK